MSERDKGGRDAVKALILVFVSLLFVFVILELTLRMTHLFGAATSFTRPDPVIGNSFVPGASYWQHSENDRPITGRINSHGWRDREWSIKPADDTQRVAVIGDSFVEAFQVEEEKTFLSIAEKELRRKGRKVELMNFGRSGFTQTEELVVLRRQVARFSPDVVMLFYLPLNDIGDVSPETASNTLRPFFGASGERLVLDTSYTDSKVYKLKSAILPIKSNSALAALVIKRVDALLYGEQALSESVAYDVGDSTISKIEGYESLATKMPEAEYRESYELTKRLIAEMIEFSESRSIRFVLVTIDTPSHVPAVEKAYARVEPSYDYRFFEDDMDDFASSKGIDHIGLQSVFRSAYVKNDQKLHWEHWNYQGHRLVASEIVKYLQQTSLAGEQ